MITRADLTPAQQAVQGIHAALAWASRHDIPADGTVVFLAVPDEYHLHLLGESLEQDGAEVAWFSEPDLGWALTAIAAHSSDGNAHTGYGRLSRLPLALRGGEYDDPAEKTAR